MDFQHINSTEYGKSRHPGTSPDDPDFAAQRDQGIAQKCVDLMRAHPGKRLAIVIGAHHKPFLDVLLSRVEGVRVLQPGADFPWPSSEEDHRGLDPKMARHRAHLATRWPGQVRHPAQRPSGWLESNACWFSWSKPKPFPGQTKYLRARWLAESGQREPKRKAPGRIAPGTDCADLELYPFPMRWWRMRYDLQEAAQIERARLTFGNPGETELRESLLASVEKAAARRLRDLSKTPGPGKGAPWPSSATPDSNSAGRPATSSPAGPTTSPLARGASPGERTKQTTSKGKRCLAVSVEEPNPKQTGFHIRQECKFPATAKQSNLQVAMALRSEGLTKLELVVRPYFSRSDPNPIKKLVLDPSLPNWQKIRFPFDLPGDGAFSIWVFFDGPKGSRLLLDDCTPLTQTYLSIPREWSRATLAHKFPRALLGFGEAFVPPITANSIEANGPLGPGPSGTLQDPGFESGKLAPNPLSGWSFHKPEGFLTPTEDKAIKTEGDRSLKILLEKPSNSMGGRIGISQNIPGCQGTPRFSIDLRSDQNTECILAAISHAKDGPNKFKEFAKKSVPIRANTWTPATLDLEIPQGSESISLFVYLPQESGRTVWLDNSQLHVVD